MCPSREPLARYTPLSSQSTAPGGSCTFGGMDTKRGRREPVEEREVVEGAEEDEDELGEKMGREIEEEEEGCTIGTPIGDLFVPLEGRLVLMTGFVPVVGGCARDVSACTLGFRDALLG